MANCRYHNRRSRKRFNSEINVTPFVDIALVLLIIFMVSAPLLVNGVPMNLPKTDGKTLDTSFKPVTVSMKQDGHLYLDNTSFSNKDDFLSALSSQMRQRPKEVQQICVRADKDISYQDVLDLLSILQQEGYTNIALLSLPK